MDGCWVLYINKYRIVVEYVIIFFCKKVFDCCFLEKLRIVVVEIFIFIIIIIIFCVQDMIDINCF